MSHEVKIPRSPTSTTSDACEINYQDSTEEVRTLALVAIEPDQDVQDQFDISRKDWLSIARIISAGDYVDATVIARMMDPQPGTEFPRDVCEDMDIALIRTLEWLDRYRADRIYLSASAVRIRDEHNYMDSNTAFLDLQESSGDPGLDSEVLYRWRNFSTFSGGFMIVRVLAVDASPIGTEAICQASRRIGRLRDA